MHKDLENVKPIKEGEERESMSETLARRQKGSDNLFIQRDTKMKSIDRLEIWHKRLAHSNYKKIIEMKDKGIVKGMEKEIFERKEVRDCDSCNIMKMTRKKFNKNTREKAKDILAVVHSDLCGPIQVRSIDGAEYILTFVDDKSRKSDVYLLRHKSEVLSYFIEYKARMEKETGKRIKTLRTDNGGEYVNAEMKNFLKSEGIKHELTAVYVPQQNGTAERLNRTLMEKTRCLLKESGLPNYFWGEALRTANRIKNHVPTKICKDQSPMEIWLGRKPNISYFKVFGCKVYVRIPKPNVCGKLGERAKMGIFMGYDDHRKAYNIWIQEERKMIQSRDVKFIENVKGWIDYIKEDKNEVKRETVYLEFGWRKQDDNEEVQVDGNKDNAQAQEPMDEVMIEEQDEAQEEVSVEDSSSEEEVESDDETSRYNLRERTENIRPEKYTVISSGKKRDKPYSLDELVYKYGIQDFD